MEIFFNIGQMFLLILGYLLTPIFRYFAKAKIPIPPSNDPLLLMSATHLSQQIRDKKISSENVVKSYIKRIKEVNPIINAVVDERYTQAINEAREADKLVSKSKNVANLEKSKPLLGVPMTIKESCSVKGLSFAVGSKSRAGIIADEDGEAVKNLRAAGAIVLLVSNTIEFCLGFETINDVTGITRNAYDINKSVASSSGGEGALLGSGASLLGIGSDLAGSIRLPALFNGIFGHKTSPGIVSNIGHIPSGSVKSLNEHLVLGPMTRYAEDLKLVLAAMAGPNITKLNLEEKVQLDKVDVYYMENSGCGMFGLHRIQPEITSKLRESVKHLRNNCDCNIREFKFKKLSEASEIATGMMVSLEDGPNFLGKPDEIWSNIFKQIIKIVKGESEYSVAVIVYHLLTKTRAFLSKNGIDHYKNEAKVLRELFISKLGNNGVFLYPTCNSSAFYHYQSLTTLPYVAYNAIFNMLGMPATHIPLGLDKSRMPIGIQVVAAPNQDRLCLAVAEELERKFGGWINPASLS